MTQLSRDGTQLAVAGPIVTGTTFTYTAQLNSFGKSDFGNYTCTATVRPYPTSTYILGVDTLSDMLNIIAGKCWYYISILMHYASYNCFNLYTVVPPPVDAQATQSTSSAPVEVSWSPPTEGDVNITGYRVFYSNGENVLVPVVITSVGLRVDRNYSGEIVFLRSESGRLYSELVNVTVGKLQSH